MGLIEAIKGRIVRNVIEGALKRLVQKTTWAGFVVWLSGLGLHISGNLSDKLIEAGIALGGALLVVYDEKRNANQ